MIPSQPLSCRPLFHSKKSIPALGKRPGSSAEMKTTPGGAPVVNIIHQDPVQTAQQDNVSNSHSNTHDTGGQMLTCPTEHILTPMPSTSIPTAYTTPSKSKTCYILNKAFYPPHTVPVCAQISNQSIRIT